MFFILEYFFVSLEIAILVLWCTFFAVGISIAGIVYLIDFIVSLIKSILSRK